MANYTIKTITKNKIVIHANMLLSEIYMIQIVGEEEALSASMF